MDNDKMLQLRMVTPMGMAIDERAASVVIWTATGEIEVLPGHAPTVVLLEPGELRVRGNGIKSYATGEGFARIEQGSVTVFSDSADNVDEITIDAAEEAKRRAEKAVAEAAKLSPDERDAADLEMKKALARIQILLKRRGGHGSH